MTRPAIFLDRDNTLIVNDGYLGDPDGVVLIPGAADAIAQMRELGYAIVVVSNQSGVARGLFTEDAVRAVNSRLNQLLQQANPQALIDRHEYCPFHPEATIAIYRQDSELRKPRPGMLLKAAELLSLDLTQSWMIGDAPRDIAAGHAAGCRTILLNSPAVAASPHASAKLHIAPDYRADSLLQAVQIIADTLQEDRSSAPSPHKPAPASPAVRAQEAAPEPSSHCAAATDTPTPDQPMPDMETATTSTSTVSQSSTKSGPPTPLAPESASDSTPHAPAPDRLTQLAEEILHELRRHGTSHHNDFSVSRLFAGISQVLVFAALFYAYLVGPPGTLSTTNTLVLAMTLQCLTIALLIMGRQR